MLRKIMIERKISRIRDYLIRLREFARLSFDDVAKDYKIHMVIERLIEVIVGHAIDINQHIIAESAKKELPFDFKKSFLILSDLEVYPREFAEKISDSAGLRNILVHEYEELDEKVFYRSIGDCYEDYVKYCEYILKYIEKLKRREL